MHRVFWILRKNFRLAAADWKGLFFAFLLPVVLATITGLAFSGSRSRPVSKLRVCVVAEDDHETVARLAAALKASDSLEVEEGIDLAQARDRVRKRKLLAAIHFPEGSGAKLASGLFTNDKARVGLLIDPSRQVERGVLQGILMRELMKILGEGMMDPERGLKMMAAGRLGLEMDATLQAEEKRRWGAVFESGSRMFRDLKAAEEAQGEGASAGGFKPDFSEPFRLEVEEVTGAQGQKFDMFAQTFAGTGVMFLLFGVAAAAGNLVQERQRGTLRRILVTPTRRIEILAGEALFYFLLSVSQLVVLFAVGTALFGIPYYGSKAGLVLIGASTAAAVTGFGILIAALGRTEKQVQGISVLVILVMSSIGGSMFPVWLMPEFMQTLAGATINKWAVMGFEGATWRGLGFVDILWPNATVLLAMGAAFFTLGALRFRWE